LGHALGTIILVRASFGAPLKSRITPAVRLGHAGYCQHGDGKRENRTQHEDLHVDAFLLGSPKTRWE
jgi:hypothetical protein